MFFLGPLSPVSADFVNPHESAWLVTLFMTEWWSTPPSRTYRTTPIPTPFHLLPIVSHLLEPRWYSRKTSFISLSTSWAAYLMSKRSEHAPWRVAPSAAHRNHTSSAALTWTAVPPERSTSSASPLWYSKRPASARTLGICELRTAGSGTLWMESSLRGLRILSILFGCCPCYLDVVHAEVQLRVCALELIYQGRSYGNH